MMRRLISLFCVAVMLISAVACGKDNSGTGKGETTGAVAETKEPVINPTLSYDSKNHAAAFENPASEYRWYMIRHDITDEYSLGGWDGNVTSLKNMGYGGIVMNSAFVEGKYLQDAADLEKLSNVIDGLLDQEMGAWLYDEYGYPSGNAGGLTTYKNPEYIAKGLVCITSIGNGKTPKTITKDNDLLKFHTAYAIDSNGKHHNVTVKDNSVTFNGTSGDWTLYVFAEKILYEGTHAEYVANNRGGQWLENKYLNIMDKNAVAAFINNTYKTYADSLKQFSSIGGIFTDEPSLMEKYQNTSSTYKYAQLAWADGFDTEFEKMHGYSILNNLHHMFGGDSDEAKIVRVNYRQTVAKLVSENYFGQINEFCVENGTYGSGHCLLEERLSDHVSYYGDLMQSLRKMGIPGVDILTGKIDEFESTSKGYYLTIKYASSAARINGINKTMLELAPNDPGINYAGTLTNASTNELWRVISLMYFNGANHINSYLYRTPFSYKTKTILNYFAKLSYMSQNAKWDGGVGVYYAVNTQQAYSVPSNNTYLPVPTIDPQKATASICDSLYKAQRDYVILDNQFIREANIENGVMFNEHVSVHSICMPAVEVMPLDVLKKLLDFESSGGKVYWIQNTPKLADKLSDNEELKALSSGFTMVSEQKAVNDINKENPLKLNIVRRTSTLYVGTYKLDDAPMYWMYNNHEMSKTLKLSYEGALAFDVYDPETGSCTRTYGNELELTIKPYYTKFVTVIY